MKCPYCNHENPSDVTVCTCGYKFTGYVESKDPRQHNSMWGEIGKNRYPTLVIISQICWFLAMLSGIVTILFSLYQIIELGLEKETFFPILYSLILGFLAVVIFLSYSEWIRIFISIEKSNFKQNILIERLINKTK